MSVPGIISPFSNSLPSGGINLSPLSAQSALMGAALNPLSFPSGQAIPTQGLSALTAAPQADDLSSAFQQVIQMILLLLMQSLSVPNLNNTVQADGSDNVQDEDPNQASAKQQDADNDTDADNGDGCNGDGNGGNAGNAGNTGNKLSKSAAPTSVSNGDGNGDQQAVLNEINQFRAQNGLPPVRLNAKLNQAAQGYSEEMARDGHFSHTSLDGTTFGQRIRRTGYQPGPATENIAKGQKSPHDAVQAWINSPGHRANLLNPDVTEIGVGRAVDADGSVYWTQDGAKPG
jgi:uncharacterized protein YkwD